MAYSKAPTTDTYSSDRISLFREINLRDGGASGKDEDYLNVFLEPVKQSKVGDQRHFIFKRSGSVLVAPSVGVGEVRGMHYWSDQSKLFYCVGRNLYVYNVNTLATTTLTNVFISTSGVVGFCEFLYNDGSVKLVASDGTATTGLVTIDTSNVVATNADTDLPAHLPYPIFLDGYVFVVEAGTANIYNSVINDPFDWDATTFISAEMEGDLIIRPARLNNYLIVFGTESIEYFWDAANPSPDSPLQRNDTPVKINRYLAGLSVYGNTLYYIGLDQNGQPNAFVLKDFKIDDIGSSSISRYLNTVHDTIAQWTGNIVSFQGHTFYVINAGNSKTWAIDVDTGLITRFAYQGNSVFDIDKSSSITTTSNVRTYFTLSDTTSAIYKFDEDLYQDSSVNFTCIITTEGNDFGTLNRKTMSRASFIGDRTPNNSNVLVQWSDDDYRSFNTGISVNLNQDLPCVRQLGSFRQRIFKFTYTDNYPLRIQDVEVDINKGKS